MHTQISFNVHAHTYVHGNCRIKPQKKKVIMRTLYPQIANHSFSSHMRPCTMIKFIICALHNAHELQTHTHTKLTLHDDCRFSLAYNKRPSVCSSFYDDYLISVFYIPNGKYGLDYYGLSLFCLTFG